MVDDEIEVSEVKIRHHHRWSAVWIIPAIAALIVIYMAWHNHNQNGKTITITFNTAEGIAPGQTQVKYRAVTLGTVSDIHLDLKNKKVIVKANMTEAADQLLTDKTQFWVVRPRLSAGSFSGVETLVSGSYIQCDPGTTEGDPKDSFAGLEDPPAVRSDENGKTFKLKTDRLGSINKGSAVYYRDIEVGEVLNYDVGNGFGPIFLTALIRAPYDKLVNKSSRFFNTSGLNVNVGPTGLQVQLQSVQALLAGGISFYTPKADDAGVPKDNVFQLFADKSEADLEDDGKPINFISYFDSSFKDIGAGSPVSIKGIQVGEVTDVKLIMDYDNAKVKVQARYMIQPARAFLSSKADSINPLVATQHLVDKGLRVKAEPGGLLPGQSGLMLEFIPKPTPVKVSLQDNAILLPADSSASGIDGAIESVSEVAAKINQIPFDQISDNLNKLLSNANGTVKGFNESSDFHSDARRMMDQFNEAARSVRLLADYLNRHPEALIQGRAKDKDKN